MNDITYHPRKNSQGKAVRLLRPHQASDASNWTDSEATATFTPDSPTPPSLNGRAIQALEQDGLGHDFSAYLGLDAFKEPRFAPPPGYKRASGAIVVEPDNRVWVVHPSNAYGGYQATFPKGTVTRGHSMRETAVREVFEESGLVVELFGFLADSKRTQSYTRYYLARRVAGTPSDMGWESQAVSLVPLNNLKSILNQTVDHPLVDRLLALMAESNLDRFHCVPN